MQLKGTMLGLHSTLSGLALLPASVIFGLLWDAFGCAVPFLFGAANLEQKGYLERKSNPDDGRSQMLFATEKAENLKVSKTAVETEFYDWLLEELTEEEKEEFTRILEKLYLRSKKESRSGFPNVIERLNLKK